MSPPGSFLVVLAPAIPSRKGGRGGTAASDK